MFSIIKYNSDNEIEKFGVNPTIPNQVAIGQNFIYIEDTYCRFIASR